MRRSSFIIVFLAILAIPIILNFVIQLPAIFPVVGEPVNWLMFWATYLGAATSFLMIVYTALTLKQNKEQLDELKRTYACELAETDGEVLSYGELVDATEIPDEIIFNHYDGIFFTDDDFFCSAN